MPRTKKAADITNTEIAKALSDVGDLLEIQGANPFKVRAYENAALTVRRHGTSMKQLVEEGADLSELPGIGKDMAGYIEELVHTGRLKRLQDLYKEVPKSLIEVTELQGLGAKKAKRLWKELKIKSLSDLKKAAEKGKIAELEGFGKKTEQNILESIEAHEKQTGRFLLADADQYVEPLMAHMRKSKDIQQLEIAGSYRRRKETVGDIDILAVAKKNKPVMDHFTKFSQVRRVVQKGDTRGTVVLASGLQVDLRIVPPKSFGAAMLYFTGSKQHNIKLRSLAIKRNLRISEYGVFKVSKGNGKKKNDSERDPWEGKQVAGKTEEEVYKTIDLPWILPELREDRGEVEAASEGKLPKLIELGDIRGDLQMHSTWSDGKDSLRKMYEGCKERGYEYMAITDHGTALPMTGGLDAKRLQQQWKEIDKITKNARKTTLLKSMEVDILEDGNLDLDDKWLAKLDIVLVSVHSKFKLSSKDQSKRVIKALKNKHVHIFGHPTARIINKRAGIELDMEQVLSCAADYNVAMEINAQPDRLDLNDDLAIRAREKGVKLVISTDAHDVANLDLMRYGVDQARRAWLEKKDVLNTKSLKQLRKAIEK